MHERSLARALVQTALAAAAGAHVVEVRARVGQLCHVDSDSLQSWFLAEAQGTEMEGARLALERPPARALCVCGWGAPAAFPLPRDCPECSGRLTFQGGNELLVESIEVSERSPYSGA